MYREEMGIVIFDGEHTVPREKASIPQKPADKYAKELPLPFSEPNTEPRQHKLIQLTALHCICTC
jgi:hypothetical protein